MEFSVKRLGLAAVKTGCIILGVFEKRCMSVPAKQLDAEANGFIQELYKRGDISGRLDSTLLLANVADLPCQRILFVGCGAADEFDANKYRKVTRAAAETLSKSGAKDAVSFLPQLELTNKSLEWRISQAVLLTSDAHYRFDKLKTKPLPEPTVWQHMTFAIAASDDLKMAVQALNYGKAISKAVTLSKDLANLPGNLCTPTYLANAARKLAKGNNSIVVKVLTEAELVKLGMGALVSVARGSRQPAKLIVIEYTGAAKTKKPFVFVGKGLTFDAGGISLKPAAGMDEMKYDMCGGAAVLATLAACTDLKLPLNVVGLIPASENLPDGNANKPGDVVTSMSGQTIEIINTDAEGRLILCDALTYASRFKPNTVIDVATLTGAVIVGLGRHPTGLLSNDEELAKELIAAGDETADRVWQLPLWDDYQEQLDSDFADMANVGGREAGTITAACFLSRFTKQFRWAHLDIAGTAWKTGKHKSATGRPVPLMIQYLLNQVRTLKQKK